MVNKNSDGNNIYTQSILQYHLYFKGTCIILFFYCLGGGILIQHFTK